MVTLQHFEPFLQGLRLHLQKKDKFCHIFGNIEYFLQEISNDTVLKLSIWKRCCVTVIKRQIKKIHISR